MALTNFAFNNTPQQFSMREAGGIKFKVFEKFIQTNDEFYQCYASFQVMSVFLPHLPLYFTVQYYIKTLLRKFGCLKFLLGGCFSACDHR